MDADLDDVRAEAFALWQEGVRDRDSPFRSPTVATRDAEGAPALRTVVLRGFDPDRRVLLFHTDRRAAKTGQLIAEPRLSLHVWDPGRKLQLRADGRAAIIAGDAARRYWDATPERSRDGYGQRPAPGSPLPDPEAARQDRLDEAAAFGNFAVVEVAMHALESLQLRRDGNRRALFRWSDAGLRGEWLAP